MDPALRSTLLKVLAGLITAILAIWAVYHFLTAPARARQEAAQATAGANTAQGGMKAAQDAIKIIVDTQAVQGRIDVVTKENHDAIFQAPGAADPIGADVARAGLRALCVRDTYRLQPACRELLNAHPADAAGEDAGSPAAP